MGGWVRRIGSLGILLLAGCGTTRVTDTQRTATEQLLVSNAVDQAVSQLDCHSLAGKSVYFDPQYLDGSIDRGYVVSSLRQHLLACGCILQEDRNKATYVVEARSGGIGTDRNAILIGVPQMNVPTIIPGQPSSIPEIPLAKKTDQKGVAKVALFAYNRVTGRPVWQSGVVQATSTAKDTWFLGVGPIMRGSVRAGTEFAGAPLLGPLSGDADDEEGSPAVAVTHPASWTEPPPPQEVGPSPLQLLAATVKPPAMLKPGELPPASSLLPAKPTSPQAAPAASSPAPRPPAPPPTPNAGGQAETAPAKLRVSGFGMLPDG